MKRTNFLRFIAAVLFVVILSAPVLSFKLGGKDLVKNGTGKRTMPIIGSVYFADLWVPQELKGGADSAILNADEPMSITLTIDSGIISRDRFVKSVTEAFTKSAAAGYPSADSGLYLNMFNDITIAKGDRFIHNYDPKVGTTVQYRSQASGQTATLGVIKGLQFKKAFFGMFLSAQPIQASLKKGMLGQ
jgi:hypothetical protein